MSPWTALVVIVAIIAYVTMRRQRHQANWQPPAEPPADLEREVIELRRRVETLERILTDNRDTLSREIEGLRDRFEKAPALIPNAILAAAGFADMRERLRKLEAIADGIDYSATHPLSPRRLC